MSRQRQPRVVAARALGAMYRGASLNRALPEALEQTRPDDRSLVQTLVYGTLRDWPLLQAIAENRLKKPLKTKDADILALILMGLHQLQSMRIPEHAAVSETVNAAKGLKKPWATGLINNLLRHWQREPDSLSEGVSEAALHAMPEWLWAQLKREWPESAAAIAKAARSHPPMTLRVNLQKMERAAYIHTLEEAGMAASAGTVAASAVTLEQPVDVQSLPAFSDGSVSVQDEAAQLAALYLAPAPNAVVLDACAAPGGKTAHLLECCPGLEMFACDISESRLERVRDTLQRIGAGATLQCLSAEDAPATFGEGRFDAILADVPCSATGVLRRNPDIKLHRSEADIESLAATQNRIVEALWKTLKPGGRLLYVTCSLLEAENDAIVEGCLSRLPDIRSVALDPRGGVNTRHGIQHLPSAAGGDGLYFALLERH